MNREGSLLFEPAKVEDIEAQVIGCLMLDNSTYPTIHQWIPEGGYFYKRHNRFIFNAAMDMLKADHTVDQLTLYEELKRRVFPDGKRDTTEQKPFQKELEEFGGVTYLAELSSGAFAFSQIEDHAKIVADRYTRRCLVMGLHEKLELAKGKEVDTDALVEQIGSMIFDLGEATHAKGPRHIADIVPIVLSRIGKESRGISTGWREVDAIIGGYKKTKYYVIAARTSVGKTTFALQQAMKAAVQGHACAVFSLEMEENENASRMLAYFSRVNERDMMDDNMTHEIRDRVQDSAKRLSDFPIWIDDDPEISPSQLLYKLRRLQHDHNIEIAFVDYLQLVIADDDQKIGGNREQQVSSMSRAMKAIAKKLDIPVVVLAQLSRKTEARFDKRPELQDLRESGSIEQDSDVVMFLYRPDFSGADSAKPDLDAGNIADPDTTEVIIAKQRGGRTGVVPMKWNDDLAIIQGQQEYDDYFNSREARIKHSKSK